MTIGLNVHLLRLPAVASLENAGRGTHAVAAVTGRKSLAMARIFTASAARDRMAEAPFTRLGMIGNAAAGERLRSGQ